VLASGYSRPRCRHNADPGRARCHADRAPDVYGPPQEQPARSSTGSSCTGSGPTLSARSSAASRSGSRIRPSAKAKLAAAMLRSDGLRPSRRHPGDSQPWLMHGRERASLPGQEQARSACYRARHGRRGRHGRAGTDPRRHRASVQTARPDGRTGGSRAAVTFVPTPPSRLFRSLLE